MSWQVHLFDIRRPGSLAEVAEAARALPTKLERNSAEPIKVRSFEVLSGLLPQPGGCKGLLRVEIDSRTRLTLPLLNSTIQAIADSVIAPLSVPRPRR